MSSKKSVVWSDFTVSDDKKKAICKICKVELKYEGGCTSNLLKHLQGVHKKTTAVPAAGSGVRKTLKDFGITTGRVCGSDRKKTIDNLVSKVITENNLPFTFVESESFRELLKYTEPNYKPMCGETVKAIVKERAFSLKSTIKKELGNCKYLSLTTDCWTSLNNESFMAITCNYIDQNWTIKSPVLETKFLAERHFADYLADQLKESIREWDIENRVVAIVHDSASNIRSIANIINDQYIDVPCSAHILQICINNAMGTSKTTNHLISKTINAANRLISHFHHSTLATNELLKRQQSMNAETDNYKLIQSVKTRWNSVCDMFERLLSLRWPVIAVLGDRNVTKLSDAKTLDLTNSQWTLIEELLPTLKKLKAASNILCGENYVSLSTVWPVTKTLINVHLHISEDSENESDLNITKQFKRDLSQQISEKFKLNDNENVNIYIIASFLDPRYKDLDFISEELRIKVYESVTNMLDVGSSSDIIEVDEPVTKRKKTMEDDFFPDKEVTETEKGEVSKYQELPTTDRNCCPLQWWAAHEDSLPRLAKLAKKFLSIPATSVAAERHFSAAGRTISKTRNRLRPGMADLILFVHRNSDMED